jgi:beta-glucosidase/6-phospho-beta-glucosidase/beta-galactosidase
VIGRLLSEGVPMIGLFLWSTIDNFEVRENARVFARQSCARQNLQWNLGVKMRFGLVSVDNDTNNPNATFERCAWRAM